MKKIVDKELLGFLTRNLCPYCNKVSMFEVVDQSKNTKFDTKVVGVTKLRTSNVLTCGNCSGKVRLVSTHISTTEVELINKGE